MQNMWMSANDVVELLEREWQSIAEKLGEEWGNFKAAYQSIIATLPENPTRADVERIADEVCSLLSRYDYTHGLLRGWQGAHAERLLLDPEKTLREQEQLNQICNRFRQLAAKEPSPDKTSPKEAQSDNSRQ